MFFCSRFNCFACNCSIVLFASTILLVVCSILLFAICSIVLVAFGTIVPLAFGTIFCLNLYSYLSHFCWKGSCDLSQYFPLSHFCLMWGCTITIGSHVYNIIEMCSTMFRICCMTFKLFMTTTNIFSHFLFYGMYFFYFRSLHIQNLFCLIDVCFLCCAHAFGG